MLFRASEVCIKQELLTRAFPGRTEQGPPRHKIQRLKIKLKDISGGCNSTHHFTSSPYYFVRLEIKMTTNMLSCFVLSNKG